MPRAIDWDLKLRGYNLKNRTRYKTVRELFEMLCKKHQYNNQIAIALKVTPYLVVEKRKEMGLSQGHRVTMIEKIRQIEGIENKTVREICREIGAKSESTVWSSLRSNGIVFRYLRENSRRISPTSTIFFSNLTRSEDGPRNLWISVIAQAVKDLKSRNRAVRDSARWWFKSHNRELPSFVGICEYLDICPATLRRKIFNADSSKIKRISGRSDRHIPGNFQHRIYG